MNCDDDTFLSAYLDGQLDSEERHLVESALVSKPELAEKLRTLASLRDLVASLNRDFSIDVTARVMGRVRMNRGARSRLLLRPVWLRMVYSSPRAALAAGIAAGLLVTVTLAVPLLTIRSHFGPFRNLANRGSNLDSQRGERAARSVSHGGTGARNAAQSETTIAASRDGSDESGSGVFGRGEHAGASQSLRVSDRSKSHTLEHYRQLLDNPNQRRLFRITDGGDGKALQQVASVLESTTRFGFYKITISQGIVIDPRHPEEATVYAALVSAKSFDTLRERLTQALPDGVDESPVDPAVVTQLADIGQVRAFRSAPFGDVLIPREGLALQNPPNAAREGEPGGDLDNLAPPEQPTIEQERSAPIGEEIVRRVTGGAGADRAPADALESGGARVVKAGADQHGAPTAIAARGANGQTPGGPAAAAASRRRETSEDTVVVLVWVARSHRG